MTVPQHLAALATANERRNARSVLRREVGAMTRNDGKLRLAELLEDPPAEMITLAIGDALLWVRRLGRSRLPHVLRGLQLTHERQVGALTRRQRAVLAAWLRGEQ